MTAGGGFSRVPRHVGFIPDGNRRWAQEHGLAKSEGYSAGLEPGWHLLHLCQTLGIEEATVYGFTQDNTHRPADQTAAFRAAVVAFVEGATQYDVALRVIGNASTPLFPKELRAYTEERIGPGPMRVNLLVNYGWDWDLQTALERGRSNGRRPITELLASSDVSRIDLIVRWGGRRRLSGFLPVQSVYADFYVVDALWPDYKPEHFYDALRWYQTTDVTLGG